MLDLHNKKLHRQISFHVHIDIIKADSVTGGGLSGKEQSEADVSVNTYAFLKVQVTGKPVELCCAIGGETIDGKPYDEIVAIARKFIFELDGFEKFAEWGLVIA